MKRLVLLVLIVILLAGGGFAGWWFFLREKPASAQAAGEPVDAGGLKGVTLTKKYVELDPFVLPILREGRVTQHLTIVLSVELAKAALAESLNPVMTRLRDAIYSELYGVFAFRYVQEAGADLPIVKQRLMAAAEKVLGPGKVESILIRASSMRAPNSA